MKELTPLEVERLASREGARYAAVVNFLCSLSGNRSDDDNNLLLDAKQYGWNSITVGAIIDGIDLAYKENNSD